MRRLGTSLAMVCFAAILGTGIASAATGGTTRPWKGSGSGTVDIASSDPSFGTITLSHLGLSTTEQSFTGSTTAQAVVTAANGDQVFEDISNITLDPSTLISTYDVTVTGGTGRFLGATGGGSAVSRLTPTGPSTPSVFSFTTTFSGTITY